MKSKQTKNITDLVSPHESLQLVRSLVPGKRFVQEQIEDDTVYGHQANQLQDELDGGAGFDLEPGDQERNNKVSKLEKLLRNKTSKHTDREHHLTNNRNKII